MRLYYFVYTYYICIISHHIVLIVSYFKATLMYNYHYFIHVSWQTIIMCTKYDTLKHTLQLLICYKFCMVIALMLERLICIQDDYDMTCIN